MEIVSKFELIILEVYLKIVLDMWKNWLSNVLIMILPIMKKVMNIQ